MIVSMQRRGRPEETGTFTTSCVNQPAAQSIPNLISGWHVLGEEKASTRHPVALNEPAAHGARVAPVMAVLDLDGSEIDPP